MILFAIAVWPGPLSVPHQGQETVRVKDSAQFSSALRKAKPGTTVLLEPGRYEGGVYAENVHGAEGRAVTVRAADPADPPRISGGTGGIHLSKVSYIEVRDLVVEGASHNGINIDDGGDIGRPSHHVVIRNVRVSDLPKGNHDGIKLSGVDDFLVTGCSVARWGGSGIDMVGCHRGVIEGGTFSDGGDSGVQAKGGSSDIVVRTCRFVDAGQRAVNIGGSTGLDYFRPPLSLVPEGRRYESKDVTVEGCTFSGSLSPIAFVGADGAVVKFNTFYRPGRWVVRILQETSTPDFVPCRNGVFEDNLVVFSSSAWSAGGFNVGPGTDALSFAFRRNHWYCFDDPSQSPPRLPVAESGGVIGKDPGLVDPARGDFGVKAGRDPVPAGAHAFRRREGG